jgi:hypothetical protein
MVVTRIPYLRPWGDDSIIISVDMLSLAGLSPTLKRVSMAVHPQLHSSCAPANLLLLVEQHASQQLSSILASAGTLTALTLS